MQRMNDDGMESKFILLKKIGQFLSDIPTVAGVHSFVITLSQHLENPFVRKLYGKFRLFGTLDFENLVDEYHHHLTIPSKCNIYIPEIVRKIEEISQILPLGNHFTRPRGLGELINSYCITFWSNYTQRTVEFELVTNELLQFLKEIHLLYSVCHDKHTYNVFGDIIGLGIELLKELKGSSEYSNPLLINDKST